ncbi:hypothetical protein BT96DRAFT_995410 [Gymnopus androsaceus JB14]|uniref:F-box domain-containing protein n=1 Tax=Gymnopus androsaceus JB14 TaxID=1447944 RepID=A0A6A4HK03_9AGAR|nr:hypothetical protein BT96DRAFT_995410 [Gymnopus androsaceus JB14]
MVEPLPNELVDDILYNLYFDKATLFNCVLVGKARVRPSQRGIFREIVLEIIDSAELYLKTTGRLDALFPEKPYLASYVQSLELRWFDFVDQGACNIHTATAKVVRRLPNVNKLSFFRVYWNRLSPLLKVAVTDLFRVPSLTQVSITEFSIDAFTELASLLCYTTHLKVLKSYVFLNDPKLPGSTILKLETEEAGKRPAPKSIELKELKLERHIREFCAWFQWDLCPFEVWNLKVLHFGVCFSVLPEKIGLVQYVGKNLEELHLTRWLPDDLNGLHEYTPNLRILHLDNLHQSVSWTPVPMIHALFRPFLNQKGKRLSLQRLIITMVLMDPPLSANSLKTWEQWTAIDALLQKPEFASIEMVDFRLSAIPRSPEVPDGVRHLLRGKLPYLETSRKMIVHSE